MSTVVDELRKIREELIRIASALEKMVPMEQQKSGEEGFGK